VKAGVNYFDTAHMYCHNNSQYTLGRAMKTIDRKKVMIATKLPMSRVEETTDFRKMLEEQLRRLDMQYIDFYHFHGLNKQSFDDKVLKLGLLKEAQKAIDEGLIHHLSFSFHGNPKDIPYIIETAEMFSSVLIQYNLLDRSNEEAIEYLNAKGVGTVIMGPVAGGRLSAPSDLANKVLGEANTTTSELAMRFVLGNNAVHCALSGMQNIDMLTENLKIAEQETPMTAADFIKAAKAMDDLKKFSDLYCTGCNYCLPCPKEINIPHIFNAFTYHNVYGLTDHAKRMYGEIGKNEKRGKPVSECVNCGICVPKCPQNIDVNKKLKEVADIFAKL